MGFRDSTICRAACSKLGGKSVARQDLRQEQTFGLQAEGHQEGDRDDDLHAEKEVCQFKPRQSLWTCLLMHAQILLTAVCCLELTGRPGVLCRVPLVARFLGAFQDSVQITIVMEWCSGGDLLEQLLQEGRAMSEARVALVVAGPLLNTLQHLHALDIIHRCAWRSNPWLWTWSKRIMLCMPACRTSEMPVSQARSS